MFLIHFSPSPQWCATPNEGVGVTGYKKLNYECLLNEPKDVGSTEPTSRNTCTSTYYSK